MRRVLSVLSLGVAVVCVFAVSSAWAQDTEKVAPKAVAKEKVAPPAASPQEPASAPKASAQEEAVFELLEAKLTSGIESGQPKDEATAFGSGDRAWLWMKTKVTGDANLRLRWTWAADQSWTMEPQRVRNGRMWYYKTLHTPGNWKVEVLAANDQVVKEMSFTVTEKSAGQEPAKP